LLVLWELGLALEGLDQVGCVRVAAHLLTAFGFKPIYLPWIGAVPAPTEVLAGWARVLWTRATGKAGT
jgi:hypothetical protein